MKFDKCVSTWSIWGFYILKKLTLANSKSTDNTCPLTTIVSSSLTRTIIGHIKNNTKYSRISYIKY